MMVVGVLAFLLAGLSIVDMFLPRPYDGVQLEADAPGELRVRDVVAGSGADRAGILPGDRIVGIARELLRSPSHAARLLNRHDIGERVPYFIASAAGYREVEVELGRRLIGDPYYGSACLLGFAFFGVGLFVLVRQPRRTASQVFFLMCILFMLFLICRLRPASYSQVDRLVLSTGTAALLFLPATFLHFFLIFPRPLWSASPVPGSRRPRIGKRAIIALLGALYGVPPLLLAVAGAVARARGVELPLISGAPRANWWLLGLYMLLGLSVLAFQARTVDSPRERRGVGLVFFGTLFGLVPFLVLAVAFPTLLHTEALLYYGVMPLVVVPVTFAYAIVRFGLLDIRVLLRKSLLYTVTSVVVTFVYAGIIALAGWLYRDTAIAGSAYAPLVLALAIVLLFEPLRRSLQGPVDRFFSAERSRLQRATVELGEALNARDDLQGVVRDLVDRLPRLLGLHFAALYLRRDRDRLVRFAGPADLPDEIPALPALMEQLQRQDRLVRVDRLGAVELRSREASHWLRRIAEHGVEVLGYLRSSRREIGLVLLSGKASRILLEDEELALVRGLLQQASMALETHLLLEERTRQAELERELEIAASIQRGLLPTSVRFAPGWQVAVACRPARHVGGDFIVELPTAVNGSSGLVLGDVAGKSVSGALVMMAAHEILSSLALTAESPEELLQLANQRLHRLGPKSFVALAYFVPGLEPGDLDYFLAGQPQPLQRLRDGVIRELPLPDHRLPLGALAGGSYRRQRVPVEIGEVVVGYSDGVVDARSATGEFFGEERLHAVLRRSATDPEAVVAAVLAAVDAFTDGEEPYDDVTLLAVARLPEACP